MQYALLQYERMGVAWGRGAAPDGSPGNTHAFSENTNAFLENANAVSENTNAFLENTNAFLGNADALS